jgi:hypothetical protein
MQILGISSDKPFLRVALLKKEGKQYKILYLKSFSLDDPEHVKQFYTTSFKGKIVSALSANDLLVRTIELNVNNPKYMKEAIDFQAEASTHFEQNQTLSVPYKIDHLKNKTEITLFTTLKKTIQKHLEEMGHLKIDPDSISAEPLALISFFQWKLPELQDAFLVHLGSEEWTCVCIEQGVLKKSHSIDRGIEQLLTALWEDRKKILSRKEIGNLAKQIDLFDLKSSPQSQLVSQFTNMKQELAKILYSFSRLCGVKPLFFTGRVDAFHQIEKALKESLKEYPESAFELSNDEKKYAIPIGLAVQNNSGSIEFRKEEFFSPKEWKKGGLYFLTLTIASILCGLSIALFSHYSDAQSKKAMAAFLHTKLSLLDPSLSNKIFIDEDSESILHRWNKAVATHSKEYPYIPQTPKVAEVLSWLYQHPVILEAEKENEPIEITHLHYQLLKYPKIDSLQEPYEGKVEIEFQTKSPLRARKFHEALHQGADLVDSSEDIHWESSLPVYRVSFFLKKRASL